MAETFSIDSCACVAQALIQTILDNKVYLSEIDGAIGDGDHGINMAKGFSLFRDRMDDSCANLSVAFKKLGLVLLTEIGGSMGPLYGTLFRKMGASLEGKTELGKADFSAMLHSALAGLGDISTAQPGDKTMMDCLVPAVAGFDDAMASHTFAEALTAMCDAAKTGQQSTKDMVAKLGRSSRLGERSRGVLDAGATSCCLLLCAMADACKTLL